MKVFLDTDVILDVLLKRKSWRASVKLFELAESNKLKLYTSAVVLSNIFYLVGKFESPKKAVVEIRKIVELVKVSKVGQQEVKLALESHLDDFEDALQYFSALNARCRFLVTRNLRDFPKGDERLLVLSPDEFLASLKELS